MQDDGVTGVVLPTGEIVKDDRVLSWHYNQHVNALRFSYEVDTTKPVGVNDLNGSVRGIDVAIGRVAVIAHRFFRYKDVIYVQDCDVKHLIRP